MTDRERQERQAEQDRARTTDYINSRIAAASKGQDRGDERQQKMSLERDRD